MEFHPGLPSSASEKEIFQRDSIDPAARPRCPALLVGRTRGRTCDGADEGSVPLIIGSINWVPRFSIMYSKWLSSRRGAETGQADWTFEPPAPPAPESWMCARRHRTATLATVNSNRDLKDEFLTVTCFCSHPLRVHAPQRSSQLRATYDWLFQASNRSWCSSRSASSFGTIRTSAPCE